MHHQSNKSQNNYIKVEPSPNVPLYSVVDKKRKSRCSSTPEYSGTDGMYTMITEESMKYSDSGKHIDESNVVNRKVKANNSVPYKIEAAKSDDAKLNMKKEKYILTHLSVLWVFTIVSFAIICISFVPSIASGFSQLSALKQDISFTGKLTKQYFTTILYN